MKNAAFAKVAAPALTPYYRDWLAITVADLVPLTQKFPGGHANIVPRNSYARLQGILYAYTHVHSQEGLDELITNMRTQVDQKQAQARTPNSLHLYWVMRHAQTAFDSVSENIKKHDTSVAPDPEKLLTAKHEIEQAAAQIMPKLVMALKREKMSEVNIDSFIPHSKIIRPTL